MTPRASRRRLTTAELVAALHTLADGLPLPQVAQALGVTPGTLRRQFLEEAWRDWCHRQGVRAVPPLPGGRA